MNIGIIKQLAENYTLDQLKQAEDDLLNERTLSIAVEGKDEGEQLTHILAAAYCREEMDKSDIGIMQAVRLYSQRVRDSIN